LPFPSDTSGDSVDPSPALEHVAGDAVGWTAQDLWEFLMRKGTSLAACR